MRHWQAADRLWINNENQRGTWKKKNSKDFRFNFLKLFFFTIFGYFCDRLHCHFAHIAEIHEYNSACCKTRKVIDEYRHYCVSIRIIQKALSEFNWKNQFEIKGHTCKSYYWIYCSWKKLVKHRSRVLVKSKLVKQRPSRPFNLILF